MPGLPPYGPEALPFSATGLGTQSEGLVVRFTTDDDSSWTGNFQPGLNGCQRIIRHPNGHDFVVISSGQGYIVNPSDPASWNHFGGCIEYVFELSDYGAVLFGNGLWFELLGIDGTLWKSRRISWDGMCDSAISYPYLTGKSWFPDDRWVDFKLDLSDGSVEGGSYWESMAL